LLDGAARVEPLVAAAAELGQKHLAMTDHGNMFGAWEFYHAARDAGVIPLIGVESYVAPESRFHKKPVRWGKARNGSDADAVEGGKDIAGGGKYLHMTMWAQDATGLRNLFRMSSEAALTGQFPRGKARVDLELMADNAAGVMVSTGCPSGGVQTRLRLGQEKEAIAYAGKLKEIFGAENVFCELMDHGVPIERQVRDGLLQVAKVVGLPFLVTNDSHYIAPDQAAAHDALLAVGVGKNLDDPTRFRFNGEGYYLKSAEEMFGVDGSAAWQEGCRNTLVLAERVAPDAYAKVFASRDLAPEFDVPEGETPASWLRKEAERGVHRRFGPRPSRQVLERVEYELKVIEEMGFPSYFLVVADLCRYARANGIMVGPGRGSATGSMVAYVLGITELDPLRYGLIFERFLNPQRVSMPDIDLDFDDRGRPEMIRYTVEKYGVANVAQIITFGKIQAKAAIKDANRILGLPFGLADQITKSLPPDKGGKPAPLSCISDSGHPQYPEASETRALMEENSDVRRVIDVAEGLEGLTRNTGVHSAGMVICREPLVDVVPLNYREEDGTVIVGFPFAECEELGLLKMDYLGLRNLTVIADTLENIRINRGTEIDLGSLTSFDDQPTYDLLSRGDTLGVFQLDGGPMRTLLKMLKPARFVDVAAAIALYRPGPMTANTHVKFALRKNGQQETTPIHPALEKALEPILGETYHLVVFQEQVMRIATDLAGYTLGGADNLRRAMGKKKRDALEKAHPEFIAGMVTNGFPREAAQAVWDVMLPFSEYGFNKSHAAGYSYVSYWTAYLKANYPAEFMAALLTSVSDNKDRMALYLAEARRMGVPVLPPDVNRSGPRFTAAGGDVRFGLGAIRNVGEHVIQAIVKTRETTGAFASFAEYLTAVPAHACSKRVVESLIKAGVFDSLGHTRQGLTAIFEPAVEAAAAVKRKEAVGQFDLFGELDDPAGTHAPAGPPLGLGLGLEPSRDEWPRDTLLAFEREMLGLYVSAHPLDHAREVLEQERSHPIAEILADPESVNGQQVTLTGLITKVDQRVSRRSGKHWAVVTVEDLEASIEILVFAGLYQLAKPLLGQDSTVRIIGRVSLRDESVSIIGEEVTTLHVPPPGTRPEPVVLTLHEERIDRDLVAELKQILEAHPGSVPVHLRVMASPIRGKLVNLPHHTIAPSRAFAADVKSLLGSDALALP
jgi:DNA polymerase-3 subunit alpha